MKEKLEKLKEEFLYLIEDCYKSLAKNIALRNKDLDTYSLNQAVQTIINRIIFLRIAEGRNIEKYGMLLQSVMWASRSQMESEKSIDQDGRFTAYYYIDQVFKNADKKYNSGLFKIEKWISNLSIDDKILQSIIRNLYYPECPYELSVLPIEILGNIYEQFLGKTIRLTASRQVKIEWKEGTPVGAHGRTSQQESRKIGGVYYTAQYIVNYIVQNTIGEKIKDIDLYNHPKLTVLDPACGSGSFLVGAYSFLLERYLEAYTEKKRRDKCIKNGLIYPISENTYRLSIKVKQHILLNHIFGVDIDHQAVEVTKLSLLLKLMEDENSESADQLFKHSNIKLDLSNNIKCGNSLIGSDFYNDKDLNLFGKEEMRKVNTFDWEKEFPNIFVENGHDRSNSGFDIVIGNPPYTLVQSLNFRQSFDYYSISYKSAKYKIDTYQLFIEKGIQLLKIRGIISFITPNTFLKNIHAEPLRDYLIHNTEIKKIVNFKYSVFKASVDTSIFNLVKGVFSPSNEIQIIESNQPDKYLFINSIKQETLKSSNRFEININFSMKDFNIDIKKMIRLKDFCDAYFGTQTYNRTIYVSNQKVDQMYKPTIDGVNIGRYILFESKEFVKFVPEAIKSGGNQKIYEKERIGIRQIGQFPIATLLPSNLYTLNTVYNLYIKKEMSYYCIQSILGILNSKWIKYYWIRNHSDAKITFPKIKKEAILSLPLPQETEKNKDSLNRLSSLVDSMLSTQKQLHEAINDSDKKLLQQKCNLLDNQIDKLVYELYGLTEDEIKIVEGK